MPNTRLHFVIFPIYAVLLVKEMEFFSLFLLLGEIRRVLSGKMATNQLKISQKIDIDSFQCIDWHREVIKVTLCVNFMTNRHLNSNTKHCAPLRRHSLWTVPYGCNILTHFENKALAMTGSGNQVNLKKSIFEKFENL